MSSPRNAIKVLIRFVASAAAAGVCACSSNSRLVGTPTGESARARMMGSVDWAAPQPTVPAWKTRAPDEIAPGYALSIENPHDTAVRGRFTVEHDGLLKLPYEVQVKAEGLTPEQLAQALNEKYGRFILHPKFRVIVDEKQYSVDVRGLVEKPGAYRVNADSSLDDVIAKAGGLARGENGDTTHKARYARVTQLGVTKMINLQDYYSGAGGLVPPWQGGETVFLQSEGPTQVSVDRDYIQILGQVAAPGAYPFQAGKDFVSYLTSAGGPTATADLDRITLLRRADDTIQEQEFELSDVSKGIAIAPGDTLIVRADTRTETERTSGVLAGFAAVLSAIGILVVGL